MLDCENCGFTNSRGSIFCGECGRLLESTSEQDPRADVTTGTLDVSKGAVPPAAGTPAAGTPAGGTPAAGTPAAGTAKSTDPTGKIVVSRDTQGEIVVKRVRPTGRFFRYECRFCKLSVKVPEGEDRCPKCGGKLEDGVETAAIDDPAITNPKPRNPAWPLAVLVRILPTGEEVEIPLDTECSVVGRTWGVPAGLVFPDDPFLSPIHAEFRYVEGGIFVKDRDTLNGILVRVDAPRLLDDGQTISIGEQILRFDVVRARAGPEMSDDDGTVPLGSGLDLPGAKLVKILADGGDGPEFHLCGRSRSFGRLVGHYTFPDDPLMSQQHARIEERAGRYWIEDLSSTNGTMVRIRETVLTADTVLKVGSQRFRMEYRNA